MDGQSGFLIRQQDSGDLIAKIEHFLSLSGKEREKLGRNGRTYMEQRFDRRLVVKEYLSMIQKFTGQV